MSLCLNPRAADGLTVDFFFLVANVPELKMVQNITFKFTTSKLATEVPLWYQRSSTLDVRQEIMILGARLGGTTSSSFKKLKQTIEHSNQAASCCQVDLKRQNRMFHETKTRNWR